MTTHSRNVLIGLEASVLGLVVARGAPAPAPEPYTNWSDYAGSPDSMQYSALKQINKTNVSKLQLAFFYPAPGPSGRFAFSPLIVDDVMFVVGKDSTINAIDASTGKELWTHSGEGIPAVYESRGKQYVAFFGGCCEKPDAGDISWVGAEPGSQGYYVFTLPN